MNLSIPNFGCSLSTNARLFLLPAIISMASACTYRFSSINPQIPDGIRSIAVEAVYDTSRELIPHEQLWSAIQHQIARSGRFILVPQDRADALITIWLQKTLINPTGTPSREPLSRDPTVTEIDKGTPDAFRNLRRAGSWTTDENVSLIAVIELHDLKNRKILKQQTYSLGSNFKSLRPVTITSTVSAYLHYTEAMEAKVKELSENIARRMMADFSL